MVSGSDCKFINQDLDALTAKFLSKILNITVFIIFPSIC